MATIQNVWVEGALTFTFPPGSMASKYDEWTHYQSQFMATCGGCKAVDLVYADGQVAWLIEVKDYRQNRRKKAIELSDEIAAKVRDTLAGLVSAKVYANNQDEKRCAKEILRARQLRVVCHLEQPIKPSRLFPRVIEPANLVMKLRTLIKAIDAHPRVVDRNSIQASMNWVVQ